MFDDEYYTMDRALPYLRNYLRALHRVSILPDSLSLIAHSVRRATSVI